MSSNLEPSGLAEATVATSAELAEAIARADFSGCAATIVGYGNMGRHFLKALQTLGVGRVRVCSTSGAALKELDGAPGVETVAAGFHDLECVPVPASWASFPRQRNRWPQPPGSSRPWASGACS